VHNTHHPIGSALYYEDQRKEAKRYSREFWKRRPQKYLGYFERVLERSGGPWLLGRRISYADLSLFQVVEGLRYAFPKTNRRLEKQIPGVVAVRDAVSARPRIAAYLASPRRIPFNEYGIFRHYRELDA
jgi:glutathione S-transferase